MRRIDRNSESLPKIIHVEDDEEWRQSVSKYIQDFGRLIYTEYICASSIEDIEIELQNVDGPVVLIMDLRLGGEVETNYSGYMWLLDNLEGFLRRNATTLTFVISGQLHDGIRATLQRKGIPNHHIFDKGEWADQRAEFVQILRDELDELDSVALSHISRGVAGRNIDPYLIHTFKIVGEHVKLPMVVATRSEDWNPDESTSGLKVLSRIGPYFSCLGDEASLVALERDSLVDYVEASRQALHLSCRAATYHRENMGFQNTSTENGDRAIIGLVCNGVDVLHSCFKTPTSKTRILSIWDQTDPTGPAPTPQLPGTLHTQEKIERYIDTGTVPDSLGRHGESVESAIAGVLAGVAPGSEFVIVIPNSRLPTPNGDQVCGLGYAVSHLTASAFILDVATQWERPVAIQLFQGMIGGAHDGSSLTELAFDEITDHGRTPGRAVIMAAGDQRRKAYHARLETVSRQLEILAWWTDASSQHCAVDVWFSSCDEYAFRVIAPNGDMTETVRPIHKRVIGSFSNGDRYALSYTRIYRNSSDSHLLVTIDSGNNGMIQAGEWRIEVQSLKTLDGSIDAWLETEPSSQGRFTDHVSDECTILIPATSRYTIAVGSLITAAPYQLTKQTGYGPTRDGRQKPETVALGEGYVAPSVAKEATRVCGVNVAASRVTGAIAKLFSAQAKVEATEDSLGSVRRPVREILESSRKRKWHKGLGFGDFDYEDLLKHLGLP